ncbi:MFS transporter [Subtercola endophyticus]|uniref:MFS transporter n=1 Tax=Subtercola endophyticus TaxID=2895559 RepID=UPI001E5A8BF8|nr:MFS transporter [Subtercola endophyticus]UFS58077.1 MFS transporter [Subtercola endophyticus]
MPTDESPAPPSAAPGSTTPPAATAAAAPAATAIPAPAAVPTSATAGMPAPAAPATDPFRHRWLILAVMLTAEIIDLIDSTVVNVAGPSLEKSLGSTATGLQWVIGGYALTLGAGLILGGRLGDRFGRRRMFVVGLSAFILTSLLCSLAPTIELLIAFRLAQGFAAAILLPQGLGLLRAAFPPSEIGKAFAVFGPVFGLAGIFGPIIGGALIQADIGGSGWRAVFLVNIPIGVAALIIALIVLPKTPGDKAIAIDLVGALIVIVSSALLVLPLVQGQAAGWPAWTWISMVAALAGFYLFTVQQRWSAKRGGTPLVTPGIFRKRSYVVGLAGIALFFASSVGAQLVFTLFLQLGEGFGAGQAGLSGIPLAIGSLIGGALSGAVLADKLGRSVLQIGAVIQLVGAGWLIFALANLASFTLWQLVPGLVLTGLGSGLVIAALFNIVLGSVDDSEVGSASGVLTAVQSIASAAGVAVLGSIFFAALNLGQPGAGYQNALIAQVVLLVVFLVLTPLFPRRARADS